MANHSSVVTFILRLRMGSFMQRHKIVCAGAYALVTSVAFGGLAAVSGCGGGDDKPEMVKSAQPPSVTAKDSMNNYLENSSKKGTKAK